MKSWLKNPLDMLAWLIFFVVQPVIFVVGMGMFINAVVQTFWK